MLPQHFDVGRIQHTVLHGLGGTQHVATHDEIHLVAELGQIGGILAGRVTAAHDCDILAFIEEAVTGGTGRHAAALEFLLGGKTEITCRGTRRDDDGVGKELAVVFRRHLERTLADVDASDFALANLCTEAQGLLADVFHHIGAVDALGIAGEVLDFGGLGELSAGLHTFINDGLHIGATSIDGCGVARRARANYQTFNMFHFIQLEVRS